MAYLADSKRYETMRYNRCGTSGIKLPALSLGLWHNFGGMDLYENARSLLLRSFDLGITHFDLANNYGPPAGSAEETLGRVLKSDLASYRDEFIISTKAGFYMWEGPYGEWGSKKNLVASLDQSLKRMNLDYVDIYYHHRPDPDTPLEETMAALDLIVRQGKALYIGISNYGNDRAQEAIAVLRQLGTPLLIHQASYSITNRWIENGLLDILEDGGAGCIAFCPLSQGLLTNRYLDGVPEDSRAKKPKSFLNENDVTETTLQKVRQLNEIASLRGQSLAQMALAWVLRDPRVTSALLGASKVAQIEENVKALDNLEFSDEERKRIDAIVNGQA